MTEYEYFTLIIRSITSIALIAGLFFTVYQLKLFRVAHNKNLTWNKRKAAQDALANTTLSDDMKELNKSINFLNRIEPIPFEELNKIFEKDKSCQNQINRVLNMYEALARGIKLGIFDEETIKQARRSAMIRTFSVFKSYIENRRKVYNMPAIFTQIESLCAKWRAEEKVFVKENSTGKI